MSATVAFTKATVDAVDRAVRCLYAETEMLQRHGLASMELEADLTELEELRGRMRCERDRRLPVARLADLRVVTG